MTCSWQYRDRVNFHFAIRIRYAIDTAWTGKFYVVIGSGGQHYPNQWLSQLNYRVLHSEYHADQAPPEEEQAPDRVGRKVKIHVCVAVSNIISPIRILCTNSCHHSLDGHPIHPDTAFPWEAHSKPCHIRCDRSHRYESPESGFRQPVYYSRCRPGSGPISPGGGICINQADPYPSPSYLPGKYPLCLREH